MEVEKLEVEKINIKQNPLKRITFNKVKKNDNKSGSCFDFLDENYFKEYDICIHKNTFKSDRYIRLAKAKVNEFNIRTKKRRIRKKKVKKEFENFFEFQYSNDSLASLRKCESIKNSSDSLCSNEDNNFKFPCISQPDTNDSNNLSYNNKNEYFSTELLLEDNEEIFHTNENLFTAEQNYSTRNLKYLEIFEKIRDMKEEEERKKSGKENFEDKTGNTLELYTTLKRKNIKKINKVMENTKNMTKNKSIYINFDYSDDDECSVKSSSYISSSEENKKCEKPLNKKSLKRTYSYSNNIVTKSDIKSQDNLSKTSKDDSEIKVDSSIDKNELGEMINERNNESKNDDEIKVDSSTDKNELNEIIDEIKDDNYKIYKNKELRNFAELVYKESCLELCNRKNSFENSKEEIITEEENEDEGLSKYISVNLQENNQKRKNYVIDKKRQLRKCKDLLNKRRDEFDRKEEQKKRERDQNIDMSEQNLKMTNVIKNILEKLKHNKNIFKLNKDLIQTNMDDKLKDLNLEELNSIYHKELEELKGKNYDIIPSNIRYDLLRKNLIKTRIINCPRINNLGLNNEALINSLREEKKNPHIPQMYLELNQMFNDEYNTLKQILKSKKQTSIDILTDLNINMKNKNEKLPKHSSYSESNIYNNINYNNNENSIYNYFKSLSYDHSKHGRYHCRHNYNNTSKSNNNRAKNHKFNNKYISSDELKRKENDKGGIIKKYKKILPAISFRRYKVPKLPKVKFDKNKNNKINKILEKNEKLFKNNQTEQHKKENKLEYLKYKSNYIIKHTILDNDKYNGIPTPYSSLDYDLYIACNQHKYINTVRSIIKKKKKEERLLRGKRKEKYHIQPNKSLKIDNSDSSNDDNKSFIEEGTESKNNNKQKNKKDVMSNNVIKGKKLGNANNNNNNNKFKTRVNETNTIKQKSRSTDIYSKIKKEKVNSQTNASKKVYNKNRKMKKDTTANNDNSIKKANEINSLTSDSVIKMCRKNKYIKSKLRAKGISLEEHEDLIRNILNDKVPKSTDDIEYIRVNNITEKETNSNQEIRNNKTSKKTKIMEEFQKINESNKHAVYDYIGLDKNENFYDYNDIIANIDSKDKFYKEIVIFDNIKKFKEMMNNELISRYKIKPHPNEEINVNKINDTVNCAFAIMGHNKERKKLVDDEKTVWHQQINEATNLYNRLIGLGIDVDKRVIMNAIVSPKDVLHLNKESSFIKNIHKIVEENRRKKLLAAKKLSKSKDNGLDRGKSSSNYEINYLNKFKNSKWNSVRSKVDCYNQLVCNSTIRNMVKYYVKKRKECRKEIKENNVIDVVPFISSFPRHYRIEPNDEWFETNFFYSDNYVNPYHNYSCLFIDDMGIFSCYNDYYL
ncbi:hypothetical protein U3516DRAFT_651408 [Neocallimastix sp. 'constans']